MTGQRRRASDSSSASFLRAISGYASYDSATVRRVAGELADRPQERADGPRRGSSGRAP